MSLWQKPDQDQNRSTPSSSTQSAQTQQVRKNSSQVEDRMSKPATIGQSVQINGELTGQEDLIIDGKIDGKIVLKDHQLTIGANGHINAEVHAKAVQINGQVSGNIIADDKVEITPSGSVIGDITAPRVALADGSSFKGSIDMGRKGQSSGTSTSTNVNRDVPLAASTGTSTHKS
jgi:cytoskeletal protein CcmA (bactofilin family)